MVSEYASKYTSLCVFLLGALALVVPKGYSVAPLMLVLASAFLLRGGVSLEKDDKKLLGVLLGFFALYLLTGLYHGLSGSSLESASRVLLAALALLVLLRYPPQAMALWGGGAVGGVGAGIVAVYDVWVLGNSRADPYMMNPIQFGYISILLGLLAMSGLEWAWNQRRRFLLVPLLLMGVLGGGLAGVLSGTRGALLAMAVVSFFYVFTHVKAFTLKRSVLALLVLFVFFVFLLQFGMFDRINVALSELRSYVNDGNAKTSVGIRLELWCQGILMAIERPLLGYGDGLAFEKLSDRLSYAWVFQLTHFHNEFLDVLVKRGVFALFVLGLFLFYPLTVFFRNINSPSLEIRAIAKTGTMLVTACIVLNLTQSFFHHNSGITFYAFSLVAVWSVFRSLSRRKEV